MKMKNRVWTLLVAVLLIIALCAGSALADTSNTIKFIVKPYKVTYNVNGGSGTAPVDSNGYSKGESATLFAPSGITAPAGKSFIGWSQNSAATTASFKPGDSVTLNESITLYAIWGSAKTYTVTCYDFNGNNGKSQTVLEGQKIKLPSLTEIGLSLTNSANKFAGWAGATGQTSGQQVGTEVTITANTSFYVAEAPTGTTEFVVTISWNDANNYDEIRPTPNDMLAGLSLTPAPNDGADKTILQDSTNSWRVIWYGLTGTGYKSTTPSVDGYSLTANTEGTVLSYNRTVGALDLAMWITNKKWDKNGDLIKFKAGQTVRFRIDVTNNGNEPLDKVLLYEVLKNAKFKKTSGYTVSKEGHALLGKINPGETVSVWATYKVTNSDTRKERVANVVGADFLRPDGTWGDSGAAVRIPINKKSSTSSTTSTTTATPVVTPSPTPAPAGQYMVEKLLRDASAIRIQYPNTTFEVIGADQILTANEYAAYQTLNTQDKILTVLNTVGFDQLVSSERMRLNLTVSETALNLMNSINARKAGLSAEERTAQQARENVYFPRQSVNVNGVQQNYFELGLKINSTGKDRIDHYTFRQLPTVNNWEHVRTVSEQ